jgi:GNAT superfamily N-acetyltransferase|tara:strand:- start:17157 stop:17726 length:570 start_codon:yes stop_codon:yes gene_type:complete
MTRQESSIQLAFHHRIAMPLDIPAINDLINISITENMKPYLSAKEIEAAKETMGVDRTLIEDGTYFIIEKTIGNKSLMVGCGGWGKRKTLYGGDHTAGRDDSLSDPATDAARIRAMYSLPAWTRKGIGALLLKLGEEAARNAGFNTIELGSTISGEALYLKCGYKELSREILIANNGSENLIITMSKQF